jgi:hypothetical protein
MVTSPEKSTLPSRSIPLLPTQVRHLFYRAGIDRAKIISFNYLLNNMYE